MLLCPHCGNQLAFQLIPQQPDTDPSDPANGPAIAQVNYSGDLDHPRLRERPLRVCRFLLARERVELTSEDIIRTTENTKTIFRTPQKYRVQIPGSMLGEYSSREIVLKTLEEKYGENSKAPARINSIRANDYLLKLGFTIVEHRSDGSTTVRRL